MSLAAAAAANARLPTVSAMPDPAAPESHLSLVSSSDGVEPWTTEDAKELYLIDRWGAGYFGVSPTGR